MIKSLKSLLRSHDLTSPAHLSPNDLVPYAPATLTSSDFFSGMFSLLSQGQHMYPLPSWPVPWPAYAIYQASI